MRISGAAGNTFGWNEAVKAAQRVQRTQAEATEETEKTGPTDTASFSQLLSGAATTESGRASLLGQGGEIRIEDIRATVKEETAIFRVNLYQRLKNAGVDTSQEIQLTTDRSGHVRVRNGHPDAEAIEGIINDSELANQFRYISANSSLVHAVDRSEAFRQEYAVDPQGAVARHAYLFNDNSQEIFSLFLTEDSATTRFDSILT